MFQYISITCFRFSVYTAVVFQVNCLLMHYSICRFPSAAVSFYHYHRHHHHCYHRHHHCHHHCHHCRHHYRHHHHLWFAEAVFYMQIPIAVSFVAAKKVHGHGFPLL